MARLLALAAFALSPFALPAQWQLRAVTPPGNVIGAVYDEARAVTVAVVVTSQPSAAQTWEWNGTAWQQNAAAGFPGATEDREGVLVYDPFARRVLLLDGEGPGSNGGWLYEYRGQSWIGLAPGSVHPPAVYTIAGAFDTVRRVVVAQFLDQTWEWDGQNWLLRAVTTSPGRIDYTRMTYDPLRQRTMMVGGVYYDPVLLATVMSQRTWEWDGSTWTLASTGGESARIDHTLAFDATRGRAVMYGGSNNGGPLFIMFNDFLDRVANSWVTLGSLPTAPLGMLGSHISVDLARGRVVLVGAETWELVRNGAPTFARLGSGCPSAGAVPQLDLDAGCMPWVGQTLRLRLSSLGSAGFAAVFFGLSATQWLGVPLPLALPGMPGCSAYVSADDGRLLAPISGTALASFAVPNATALVGVQFFAQGLVPAPAANPAGLVVSNAVAMQVGLP